MGGGALIRKLLVSALLTLAVCTVGFHCHAAGACDTVSIVFTHDMHSHLETETVTRGGATARAGGFAKLKTAIDAVKSEYPHTFVLDAGDFSMGTPYQTIFSTEAAELCLMGAIGFDATTLGNHEFDYRGPGLARMLTAAEESGERLPLLVQGNIDWERSFADPARAENAALVKAALEQYGSGEYTVLEKGGITIAVFGILGREADSYAPESGLFFLDPIRQATQIVAKIREAADPDLIICLSHSGTSDNPEESEDELLARAVPEIDLIISGHSHTKLDEPITHGNTVIASCGSYTYHLGHLTFAKSGDGYRLERYRLIPLDGSVADDPAVLERIGAYKALVNEQYMAQFGYGFDEVLAVSGFAFTPIEQFGAAQGEDTLANLISDSYIYAVKHAEGSDYRPVDVAVVPAGVVRGSFDEGEITAGDAFNVSSLGIGPDGVPGYPLVSVYLTGAELKTLAEVDISVSGLMPAARLYSSGLSYTYNPNRLILNRVTGVKLVTGHGTEEPEETGLYRVVGGLYSCQMLGAVERKSHGLLKLVPKDENGSAITVFERHIIYDGGHELKEWVALARYLASFEPENGIPKIPADYAQTQGRKIEVKSSHPVELLKNPNRIFFLALAVLVVIVLLAAGFILLAVRLVRARKRKKPS